MKPARRLAFLLFLVLVPAAAAQDAVRPLPARLDEVLAGGDTTATRSEIGRSRSGKPILAVEVASRDGTLPPARRPAVLVVAGLTGHHLAGTEAVLHHIRSLVTQRDEATVELLRSSVFYLVPQANPDAAAAFATNRGVEPRGNLAPVDDDRDGREDEDGGDDVNGDGLVTQMRVQDPGGEWLADPTDPRVMRKADRAKGERGTHRILVEGRDDDGDGEWNEDGPGGVDLDRNFPHGFAEHDLGSGRFAVSEPETRALVDFVLARPNIALVLVYGLADTLLAAPRSDARTERVPPNGIMPADLPVYRELGESYRKLTGRSGKQADRHDGSLWSWCYAHVGVPSFAASFWTIPAETAAGAASRPATRPAGETRPAGGARGGDPGRRMLSLVDLGPEPEGAAPPQDPMEQTSGAPRTTPAGPGQGPPTVPGQGQGRGGRRGGGQGAAPPAQTADGAQGIDDQGVREERARLAWDDARGAGGFVPWTRVDVQGLEHAEVGGWRPGVLVTPPPAEMTALLESHHRFLLDLAGWLPRVAIPEVKVVAKGGDVFDVTCIVSNEGKLPLRTATGARTNQPKRSRIVLTPGDAAVLMGETHRRVDDLAAGRRQEFRWVLRAPAGTKVKIAVATSLAGDAEKTVELR